MGSNCNSSAFHYAVEHDHLQNIKMQKATDESSLSTNTEIIDGIKVRQGNDDEEKFTMLEEKERRLKEVLTDVDYNLLVIYDIFCLSLTSKMKDLRHN